MQTLKKNKTATILIDDLATIATDKNGNQYVKETAISIQVIDGKIVIQSALGSIAEAEIKNGAVYLTLKG